MLTRRAAATNAVPNLTRGAPKRCRAAASPTTAALQRAATASGRAAALRRHARCGQPRARTNPSGHRDAVAWSRVFVGVTRARSADGRRPLGERCRDAAAVRNRGAHRRRVADHSRERRHGAAVVRRQARCFDVRARVDGCAPRGMCPISREHGTESRRQSRHVGDARAAGPAAPPALSQARMPVAVGSGTTVAPDLGPAPESIPTLYEFEACPFLCGNQPLVSPDSKFAKISLRCSGARPLQAARKENASRRLVNAQVPFAGRCVRR